MFDWFTKKVKKDEFELHKRAVQTALNSAKQDILNTSKWIKHLDSNDSELKEDIEEVYEEIASIKEDIEEIKNMLSFGLNKQPFKQRQTAVHKQTAVYTVQNDVQTAVQAEILERLSMSEKALVMILINSDMKLSYEDLGAMLNKDSTTIRGQVNSIKQKCEGLIAEKIEKNNKKRLYIPEEIRNSLFKKAKVRGRKKSRK